MPTTSVIVVSYNHENFIEACLASIAAQDVTSLEVICVDDGSTDSSAARAKAFDDLSLRSHVKPNGGPSDAFNFGLTRATGDYIIITSADDTMLPGSISRRVEALDAGTADIVCGLAEWIDGTGKALKPWDHPDLFAPFDLGPVDMFKRLYYHGNFVCAPSVAMRRRTFEELGAFDLNLFQLQDLEYWIRACAAGKRFYCLDDALVGYRWHGGNLSTSDSERSKAEVARISRSIVDVLPRDFMRAVLYGDMHHLFSLDLRDSELAALIMLDHHLEETRRMGRDRLAACAADPSRRRAICRSLLF